MRTQHNTILTLAACGLALSTTATGRTWIVDDDCTPPANCDCSEIQPCVDLAAPGDTVFVREGVYTAKEERTVDIGGPVITVSANVFMKDGVHIEGQDVFGAPAVIIDGGGNGPAIFAGGVGAATSLTTVIIRDGFALGGGFGAVGGGMLCAGSDLQIRGVDFSNNQANGDGGAVACIISSSPTITASTFSGNQAGSAGGAIYAGDGSATLDDNVFTANRAPSGAAVWFSASGSITNCGFLDNRTPGAAAASLIITDGPATGALVTIEGNSFIDNSSALTVVSALTTEVRSNTIVDGDTGILVDTDDMVTIERNIVASMSTAGVHVLGGAAPDLSCNDVWDTGAAYLGISDPTGTAGNLALDPMFCTPALTIAETSPCAPAQSGACGLIGAFDVGCTPSAVAPVTWGALKSHFRSPRPR